VKTTTDIVEGLLPPDSPPIV